MRLALPILLLSCLIALGQAFTLRDTAFVGAAQAASAGYTYLVKQNFETATTGYDNGETWTETEGGDSIVDPVYTGTVLKGTQSLRCTSTSGAAGAYTSVVGSELYARFMFQTTTNGFAAIFALQDNPLTTYGARALLNADNTLGILTSEHATVSTVSTVSTGQTYYVWVHYKKGTGANSVASVAFSTTSTEPTSGDNYAELTDGASTIDIEEAYVQQGIDLALIWVFDQVLIGATKIPDGTGP